MRRETFTVSIPAEAYRQLAWRANLEGCTVADLAARWAKREAEEAARTQSLCQCGACGAYQDAEKQPRRPRPGQCIECGSADLHPAEFVNWQAARYARTRADGFDGLAEVLYPARLRKAGG